MSQPVICNLLVTRPNGQADELLQQLQQRGFGVVHQPLIDIAPITDSPVLKQTMMNLDLFHTVISVSANASELALDWIDQFWPQLPVDIEWLAVGPTSAAPFSPLGITPTTPELAKTEGMLALPELQADVIAGQKILILRGEGGRETLAEVLTERGAHITYAELYRRAPIELAKGQLQDLCEQNQIRAAILTSGDLVKQFVTQLTDKRLLDSLIVIVPSERVAQYAKELGAVHVVNSEGANSQSLVNCVMALVEAGTFS